MGTKPTPAKTDYSITSGIFHELIERRPDDIHGVTSDVIKRMQGVSTPSEQVATLKTIVSYYFQQRPNGNLREIYRICMQALSLEKELPIACDLMSFMLLEYQKVKKTKIELDKVAEFLNALSRIEPDKNVVESLYFNALSEYLKAPDFDPTEALIFVRRFVDQEAAHALKNNPHNLRRKDLSSSLEESANKMRNQIFNAYLRNQNFNPEKALLIDEAISDDNKEEHENRLLRILQTCSRVNQWEHWDQFIVGTIAAKAPRNREIRALKEQLLNQGRAVSKKRTKSADN